LGVEEWLVLAKKTWREIVEKDYQARKLNHESYKIDEADNG